MSMYPRLGKHLILFAIMVATATFLLTTAFHEPKKCLVIEHWEDAPTLEDL